MALRPLAVAAALALLSFSPAARAAPAATWTVDAPASRLGFTARVNGAAIDGTFRRWTAQIAFDPADLAASAVTVVVDTGSAATGDQTRDEALPSADWFAAAAFPKAVFRSRQIQAAGPGRYVAQGDLTIRNTTRPVSLPFTLSIAGGTAMMSGGLTVDRSAFGVGQGQWRTGDAVALKVDVKVAVTAHRSAVAHGK